VHRVVAGVVLAFIAGGLLTIQAPFFSSIRNQKVVFALKVKLTPEEQERFKTAPTSNLEAYDYYLRGWQLAWRLTKETNIQARQMFEKALALDPQYAGVYTGLGFTYFVEWSLQWSADPQNLARAEEMFQRAIVLDESLPLAHSSLGFVKLNQKRCCGSCHSSRWRGGSTRPPGKIQQS